MAHDLDLTTLRAFVAVAETGSFSLAGQQLHRVQSAISQQVQRLETRLGEMLFERDARQVRLSAAGRAFLPHARQMLALNDQALDVIRHRPASCTLMLGMPDTLAAGWIAPLLQTLGSRMPWLHLSVRCDYSPILWQQWRAGTLDLVIAQDAPDDVEATPLHRERLHWISAKGSRAQWADPLQLACFTEGCCDREHTLRALEDAGRRFHVALASRSHAAILAGVASGRMVAALPARTIGRNGRFCLVEAGDGLPALPSIEVSMACRPGQGTPASSAGSLREPGLPELVQRVFRATVP